MPETLTTPKQSWTSGLSESDRLKRLRAMHRVRVLGWSMESVARRLGISTRTLYHWFVQIEADFIDRLDDEGDGQWEAFLEHREAI